MVLRWCQHQKGCSYIHLGWQRRKCAFDLQEARRICQISLVRRRGRVFIINKTIGPLKLPSKLVNSSIRNITELSQIYTKFIYKIFSKIVRVHNHYYTPTIFLESISCILSNIIYKIYNLNMVSYIEKELLLLSDYDILDLPREVNLLKIKLELLLNCTEFIDNPLLSQKIANRIITEEIDVIDDLHDINEFFDCENKIQDRDFFKELIIKLKEYTHKKTVKH